MQPLTWLRGDLHAHTTHSDGLESVEAVGARASAAGLAFLAITDHNTTSHHAAMAALPASNLVLIPGQEVTTPLGHLNVWGPMPACVDPRPTEAGMGAIIALARQAGAVASINHPKPGGPPWLYGLEHPVAAMEVWQTHWACHNAHSLALWDRQLAAGRRLTAVGGSDYHGLVDPLTALRRIGWPTTWVRASAASAAAILEAVCAGRVTISACPGGPRVDLRARTRESDAGVGETLARQPAEAIEAAVTVSGGAGCRLRVVADQAIAAEAPIEGDDFTFGLQLTVQRYVRAEVLGESAEAARLPSLPTGWDPSDARQALSNPIYVQERL